MRSPRKRTRLTSGDRPRNEARRRTRAFGLVALQLARMASMQEPGSIEQALADLVGPSRERAEASFAYLMLRSRPRLESWLQPFVRSGDDREDLIQEVGIRVWKSRESFELRGINFWWAYLKQITVRCGIDHVRSPEPEVADDPGNIERIPDHEFSIFMDLLDHIGERERLYKLADEFWLGPRPPDHARRVLAAKLFYLDGLPWSEVCELLAGGFPGRKPLRRETLDEWLGDAVLLRYLACEALYLSSEKLADMVLEIEPEGEESFEELVAMATAVKTTEGRQKWTSDEIFIILWRYKYGKLLDQIGHMSGCVLKKKDMQEVFDRCRDNFPFLSLMRQLKAVVDRTPGSKGSLAQPQIWKRIVFQYFAAEELAHRDIYDRTAPPAEMAGYALTLGMLNVWLSNGRLLKQLAQYAAAQQGEPR